MKIKTGDKVKVLAGKDRGRETTVLKVLPNEARVVLEGVNLVKRRQRPRREGQKGEVVERPTSVHISNVAFYCPKCKKGVRLGYQVTGSAKVRICRSCQATI